MLIIILSYRIYAQALDSIVDQRNSFGIDIPYIKVGHLPSEIAINPDTNKVYVANCLSNTVSVIDGNTMDKKDIRVGACPSHIAVNPSINTIYVVNTRSHSVSVIDSNNDTKKTRDIPVGEEPNYITVDPNLNTVYVINACPNYNYPIIIDNCVSVIDGNDNTKVGDIHMKNQPSSIAIYDTSPGELSQIAVSTSATNSVKLFQWNPIIMNGLKNKIINLTISNVTVGPNPTSIVAINPHTLYVANSAILRKNFVSVINVTGMFGAKEVMKIPVGSLPTFIAVNPTTNLTYVSNTHSDSVSVIDGNTNTKLRDIPVGEEPGPIAINPNTNTIYVANERSDTISVIDGKSNALNRTLTMGMKLKSYTTMTMAVDSEKNIVYVANPLSNTVSAIDSLTNKIVAGVTFNVSPFNAGHIKCDIEFPRNKFQTLEFPTNKYLYVEAGTHCIAEGNNGFQFSSWIENLGKNSTKNITPVTKTSFWYTPIVSWFKSIVDDLGLKVFKDDSSATFNVTRYGTFTANFKTLPPPIPPEFVATLFTVVVTAFVGSWLTPAFIGWRNAKKQGRRLDYYHNELRKLYDDGKLDKKDIGKLDKLRDSIRNEYTRGKINKEQYDNLVDEISIYYTEIFTKYIDSLNNLSQIEKINLLVGIKHDIDDAHDKGRIDNEHYTNLKKRVSILYEETFEEQICSLDNLPNDDKESLLNKIRNKISEAYSKEMIDELHYSLLKEKLSNYEKIKA